MQELWDSIINLPYYFAYLILDFIEWVLSIVSPVTSDYDIQARINALPVELIQLMGYVNIFHALTLISGALAIRALLMIFGR